jgi:hypothetical protein
MSEQPSPPTSSSAAQQQEIQQKWQQLLCFAARNATSNNASRATTPSQWAAQATALLQQAAAKRTPAGASNLNKHGRRSSLSSVESSSMRLSMAAGSKAPKKTASLPARRQSIAAMNAAAPTPPSTPLQKPMALEQQIMLIEQLKRICALPGFSSTPFAAILKRAIEQSTSASSQQQQQLQANPDQGSELFKRARDNEPIVEDPETNLKRLQFCLKLAHFKVRKGWERIPVARIRQRLHSNNATAKYAHERRMSMTSALDVLSYAAELASSRYQLEHELHAATKKKPIRSTRKGRLTGRRGSAPAVSFAANQKSARTATSANAAASFPNLEQFTSGSWSPQSLVDIQEEDLGFHGDEDDAAIAMSPHIYGQLGRPLIPPTF